MKFTFYPAGTWEGTLTPNADTYFYNHGGGMIYGSEPTMVIGEWTTYGDIWQSLLRFEIPGFQSGRIETATLTLTYYARPTYPTPTDRTMKVHACLGEWDESTARWGNKPPMSSASIQELPLTLDGDCYKKKYAWTLTPDAALAALADGIYLLQGWPTIDTLSYATWATKETPSRYHPTLEVKLA